MNATASEEPKDQPLTVCQVCLDAFGSESEKRPRMVTCGHSFCHYCLKEWWTTQKNVCPTCKQNTNFSSIDEVPINFELQNAAQEISKLQDSLSSLKRSYSVMQSGETELKFEGHCSEHNLPNHLKCIGCSLWICGSCHVLEHTMCKVVLYVDIVSPLKREINDSINTLKEHYVKKLKIFNSEYENLNKIRKELKTKLMTIENKLETFEKEKSKYKNIIQNLEEQKQSLMNCKRVRDYEIVKNSIDEFKSNLLIGGIQTFEVENLKLLENRLTVLDPSIFCEKNNVTLYEKLPEGSPVKYGRIEVGSDDRIRIHHFEESTSKSDMNPIQFENLLSAFNVQHFLPLEVFFKVYRANQFMGEIIVQVDSLSPRGLNLIIGASGILLKSHRKAKIFRCNITCYMA